MVLRNIYKEHHILIYSLENLSKQHLEVLNMETKKTHNVTDDVTGKVWVAERSHNADNFRNHEIVRIDADIMSIKQTKDGAVNSLNMSAKAYIASLISADLGIVVTAERMKAKLEEDEPVQIGATSPQVATAVADNSNAEPLKLLVRQLTDAIKAAKTKPTQAQVVAKINGLAIKQSLKNGAIKAICPEMVSTPIPDISF